MCLSSCLLITTMTTARPALLDDAARGVQRGEATLVVPDRALCVDLLVMTNRYRCKKLLQDRLFAGIMMV
jgi:hypothetical protein